MFSVVRGWFASMSLERKCLLFFGSALMVLMFIAFLVVEKLGRELVKNLPRNRAVDFSNGEVLRRHLDAIWADAMPETTAADKRLLVDEVRRSILSEDDETRVEYEIMGPAAPVDDAAMGSAPARSTGDSPAGTPATQNPPDERPRSPVAPTSGQNARRRRYNDLPPRGRSSTRSNNVC